MPEPQPDTGNQRIGAEEAQAPEARLNRGPAFVPLAKTPRASEFGVTPQAPAAPEEADDEADHEADNEPESAAPRPRKPGLFDKLRLRKKPRPADNPGADDDEGEGPSDAGTPVGDDIDTDPDGDDDGDPDDQPRRRLKLPIPSGRRARAAAAVGLSIAVLGGALAYPKIFPANAARAEKGDPAEEDIEQPEIPDSSTAARENRQPVVAAIPSGRDPAAPRSRVNHPAAAEPGLPDEPSILPDPTTIVPPSKSGVRLASTNQPEPLDEPAPLPAGAGATIGDEPTPLPSDALSTRGQNLARSRLDEPPPLDLNEPAGLPAPASTPPAVEEPAPAPAPAPARQPSAVANARPGEGRQPPSLLDDPAPTPTPTPTTTQAPPAAAPAPPADAGNFVEIPNVRKTRGAAVAGGAAVGSLAMATIDGGPSSRVRPMMDQPSGLEPAVTESVEPILHRVTSGQNFQTISKYYYATTRYWKALWAANRATVPAPEMLAVGMTIKIPMAEELDTRYVGPESPAAETAEPSTIRSTPRNGSAGRVPTSRFDPANDPPRRNGKPTHTVRRNGETLRSIARDRLGDTSRAQEIYELNAERLDGASPSLKVGTTLRLPDDARPEQP